MSDSITIKPKKLSGTVYIPPSKSVAHRSIICAGLAAGPSRIGNLDLSEDIHATIQAMKALGSVITVENSTAFCDGATFYQPLKNAMIDCNESGSTIRFLIPIALAKGGTYTFTGKERLLARPLTPFYEICKQDSIDYQIFEDKIVFSGQLKGGKYEIPGDISSQFITGLLFALPLLKKDSTIYVTTALESRGYIDLTLQALAAFGIEITHRDYQAFFIKGGSRYRPYNTSIEGDYSQAAFYLAANALGSHVNILGLNKDSLQGDKEILSIIKAMGNPLKAQTIDVSQIPDLVPILAVLATQSDGTTTFTGGKRLRIKESDRLHTTTTELNRLGADIKEMEDGLVIHGKRILKGGVCHAHNDHRIAMALAIAATVCRDEVTILGSSCVKKSYGRFWNDYFCLRGECYE